MNTLDDLRATLDRHAGDAHGDPSLARVAAVEGRARVVRRRRSGGVVAASVLAVVGVTVVSALPGPDRPEPDPASAPDTLTSLGWTYRLTDTAGSGGGRVSLSLPASDLPRLVTWSTDGADQSVVVRADGRRWESSVADFGDFVQVPPEATSRISVRGPAGLTLATYTVDAAEPPEGAGEGLATFREEVAGDPLVAATVSPVGSDEATLTYEVPSRGARLRVLCSGAPRNTWAHVSLGPGEGEQLFGSSCGGPFDPGATGLLVEPAGRPGDTVTANVYLTEGEAGPRVTGDGLRVGLGAYGVSDPRARVAGWDVAQFVEYEGHLWELDSASDQGPGSPTLAVTNRESGPRLAVAVFTGAGDRAVDIFTTAGGVTKNRTGNGRSTFVLDPGERSTMAVGVPVPDGVRLGYAIYQRAD